MWFGFLMGTLGLTRLITSIIVGKKLHEIGSTNAVTIGLMLIFVQLAGLGSVYFVTNKTAFMILAFASNICGGIGVGLNSTSIISILTTHYRENVQTMVAYSVGTDAMARIFAPIIGSGLYAVGGYLASFYAVSLFNLFFYFLLVSPVLVLIKCKENENEKRYSVKNPPNNSIGYCELFSIKRFTFGFIGIFL
jgi:MFS family permease